MPRILVWSFGLSILASGCIDSPVPQAGDTVSPTLFEEANWQPGTDTQVTVRMEATDTSGQTRSLGFFTASSKNPVAEIAFFDADGDSIALNETMLSHRC